MKRSRFASLCLNKLSQLYVITNDTDPCEDADHVNEFSILNNDLRRLDESEFLTQCHVVLGGATWCPWCDPCFSSSNRLL